MEDNQNTPQTEGPQARYFFLPTAEFQSLVDGQSGAVSLAEAKKQISEEYGTEIPEGGVTIFMQSTLIRKRKPRPVASELVTESLRKLGPRAKKAEAPAIESAAE